jgi:hypothetical protein
MSESAFGDGPRPPSIVSRRIADLSGAPALRHARSAALYSEMAAGGGGASTA